MSFAFAIKNADGNEIDTINIGQVFPGTIPRGTVTITNTGTETPSDARLTVSTLDWTWTGSLDIRGQEIVTEKWLQAKIGAGSWTPIGGLFTTAGNYLSVTPPAPGDSVDVELQLVVPAGSATGGDCGFTLELAVTP